jgi:hypothetical protein
VVFGDWVLIFGLKPEGGNCHDPLAKANGNIGLSRCKSRLLNIAVGFGPICFTAVF